MRGLHHCQEQTALDEVLYVVPVANSYPTSMDGTGQVIAVCEVRYEQSALNKVLKASIRHIFESFPQIASS